MALRHEAVQPSTPPTPDGKRTNGRERHLWVSHRHGTATEEQSRRASQALTQSQTNQESHIPTAVKVAAIGVSAPIAAALILDGLHAVDSQIPDAQTAITQALGALSGNGKDQQPAAPPAAATSTAGPSSKDQTPTPTATSAELNQSQVDGIIAQFKSVEPGHQFSADVQQNGAVVTFYDVTNGEHVKVATWGSSAGTINNNLDANTGTITENSTKTTPPTFRF
ncbi:MAG: hypothetical protein KGL95_05600, partial [Patescibacteria group bacterium]|nr:hypothetical protein [Patescibacteria group bacterium]